MSTHTAVMDTMNGRREIEFATVDEAEAYFATVTPDTDGTIIPNVSDETKDVMTMIRGLEHNSGQYWHGNLYGIIYSPIPE